MQEELDQSDESNAIAIIGMSGCFPGANNLQDYWSNISKGSESVKFLSIDEMRAYGVPNALLHNENYIRACTFLDEVQYFDAEFFNISPREARLIDPQHRLLLQHAYAAFEDSACIPDRIKGPVGVFAGIGLNSYLLDNILANSNGDWSDIKVIAGNDKSYACTRIAHKLNLTGPCVSVDTACSTSLVAVHLACQSLLSYECDAALAGAAKVNLPLGQGYLYEEGSIYTPDGHTRTFDKNASGTLMSSGVGVVILKRLEDAISDGDQIRAVIHGSAINNDGSNKIDYTAPSVNGQAEVIASALAMAGIKSSDVSYIEAHGTGTALGDPVELAALREVFKDNGVQRTSICKLGAIKANIGHPDVAAGMAGLIKTVLMLEEEKIPPVANYNEANPKIDFGHNLFEVNAELCDWETDNDERYAGISSFGIGGTNAHIVLGQAPQLCRRENHYKETSKPVLLPVSAKNNEDLYLQLRNLGKEFAEKSSRLNPVYGNNYLQDAALTLQSGRQPFSKRVCVIGHDLDSVANSLQHDTDALMAGTVDVLPNIPMVAFIFPGQGSQKPAMAADLYREFSVFRENFDRCADYLVDIMGIDLHKLIFDGKDTLEQTSLTQPALFVVEYSLAQTWVALGLKPQAMLGHSIGEYAAACLAGVFSLEDALKIVVKRGHLMQSVKQGSMLSLQCDEQTAHNLLTSINRGNCDIAVINSPQQTVIAGDIDDIKIIEAAMKKRNVPTQYLKTSHAFHSFMLDDVLEEFRDFLKPFSFKMPSIPFISNVTGDWVDDAVVTPDYWVKQLRHTVRFSEGVVNLAKHVDVILDVGPGAIIPAMVRQCLQAEVNDLNVTVTSSMPHARQEESETRVFLKSLAHVWQLGCEINWSVLQKDYKGHKISLPSYPFARTKHWLDPADAGDDSKKLIPKIDQHAQLLVPVWQKVPHIIKAGQEQSVYVIVANSIDDKVLENLSADLASRNKRVLLAGGSHSLWHGKAEAFYQMDIHDIKEWEGFWALVSDWSEGLDIHVIYAATHLYHCDDVGGYENAPFVQKEAGQFYLKEAFDVPIMLAKTAAESGMAINITFLSSSLHAIMPNDRINIHRNALIGPWRVIPQEYPDIHCSLIDININDGKEEESSSLLTDLILSKQNEDVCLSLSHGCYWKQVLEPIHLDAEEKFPTVKVGGRYVVLGGLSEVVRAFLKHWLLDINCELWLFGRRALPDETLWNDIFESDQEAYAFLGDLITLRDRGIKLNYRQLDVSDTDTLFRILSELESEKAINGLFHFVAHPGNDMIAIKERMRNKYVFDAKLSPLYAIDAWLDKSHPDFVMLASSLVAWTGGPGQADYCAINNIVESYALHKNGVVKALSWDAWNKTGMNNPKEGHFLFDGWFDHVATMETQADNILFKISPRTAKAWPIVEHRLSGQAVMPGTAAVDAVLQAYSSIDDNELPVTLKGVEFLQPLPASTISQGIVEIRFSKLSDGWNVQLCSHSGSRIYMSAMITLSGMSDNKNIGHTQKPNTQIAISDLPAMSSGELALGPHWNMPIAYKREGQHLYVSTELPRFLSQDLDEFIVQPAIFDLLGLTAPLVLDNSQRIYVPAAYEQIGVYKRISGDALFEIEMQKQSQSEIEFNCFIYNSDNELCINITGFSLRAIQMITAASASVPSSSFEHFSQSLSPSEAISLTTGAMCISNVSTFLVAGSDPLYRAALWRENIRKQRAESSRRAQADVLLDHDAENQTLLMLANIWSEQLGVACLKMDDDFFELGGTSLTAMQIATHIRNQISIDLDLRVIFEKPTLRQLFDHIESLHGENAQLQDSYGLSKVGLTPVPGKERVLLSLQQLRLWHLSKIDGGNASYNIPVAIKCDGVLDFILLKLGLLNIIRRHETLRTKFVNDGAHIFQEVMPVNNIEFPLIDLSNLEQDDKENESKRLISNDGSFVFDVDAYPLWSVKLIRLDNDQNILLLNLHHTIFDHWSIGLFMTELSQELLLNKLDDPKFQYRDYAYTQALQTEDGILKKQLNYWRNKLADIPDYLALPTDWPRPNQQTFKGSDYKFEFPSALIDDVRNKAMKSNVSLYIFLLAAFKVLLHKLCGETDIAIGTPIANRSHPELEKMMGFFANTIVIYNKLNTSHSFLEWLMDVRESAFDAYTNQDVDFEQVVDAVGASRGLSYTPLFQVVFVLQNSPAEEIPIPGLEMQIIEQHNNTAKFDFALSFYETKAGGLYGAVEYRSDLFSRQTVQRWMEQYEALLSNVVDAIDQPIHEISLIRSACTNEVLGSESVEEFIL